MEFWCRLEEFVAADVVVVDAVGNYRSRLVVCLDLWGAIGRNFDGYNRTGCCKIALARS